MTPIEGSTKENNAADDQRPDAVDSRPRYQRAVRAGSNGEIMLVTQDGSIEDSLGRVMQFSIERFVEEICHGGHCFVCGAPPHESAFNDEHVIPQWVLRRHGLHSQSVTLPNGQAVSYGRYTVPCCQDCNEALGLEIEQPISELLTGGYTQVAQRLTKDGPGLLFQWLALLFFKTHLKDLQFRGNPDLREPSLQIGETYDWHGLHHIHCIARSVYTQPTIAPDIGSLLVLPALNVPSIPPFDYVDLYEGRTVLLRTDDVALIAVLDDANAVLSLQKNLLHALQAILSPLQIREVAARMAYTNMGITHRPAFYTEVGTSGIHIGVRRPPAPIFTGKPPPCPEYGRVLHTACGSMLRDLGTVDEQLEQIDRGDWTCLFDEDGNVVDHSSESQ